jgi:hypothetical protein
LPKAVCLSRSRLPQARRLTPKIHLPAMTSSSISKASNLSWPISISSNRPPLWKSSSRSRSRQRLSYQPTAYQQNAPAPVAPSAPVYAAPVYQAPTPAYRAPEPVAPAPVYSAPDFALDATEELPFDPSMISDAEYQMEAVGDMHVPTCRPSSSRSRLPRCPTSISTSMPRLPIC